MSILSKGLVSQRSRLLAQGHRAIYFARYDSSTSQFRRSSRLTYLASIGATALGIAYYFFILSESRSAPTHLQPLSPSYFIPLTLTSSEISGPDTRLLTLTVPPHLIPGSVSDLAPIWSVYIKDDDIQVERPYTPLEGIDEGGRMLFWIKKYDKGEVGRWLHSKTVGDIIEIRGPFKTWVWEEGVWDEIVMISGGTGITPFYQLLNNVFKIPSDSDSTTRFTLLHSSRIPSELPPHSMLEALTVFADTQPHRFKMQLFVDSLDGPTNPSLPAQTLQISRINKAAIMHALGLDGPISWWQRLAKSTGASKAAKPQKILFLVCGPAQMTATIAGPHGRNFSQGEVGGFLGELGYTSSEVRKL